MTGGNKITLNDGTDIKFKICSQEEMEAKKNKRTDSDILIINEEGNNKFLVDFLINEQEEEKWGPIFYKNEKVIVSRDGGIGPVFFILLKMR